MNKDISMFKNQYDQVICKNETELRFVNDVAKKLGKKEFTEIFIQHCGYPVNIFLHGDMIRWNNSEDRIGTKYTFEFFKEGFESGKFN